MSQHMCQRHLFHLACIEHHTCRRRIMFESSASYHATRCYENHGGVGHVHHDTALGTSGVDCAAADCARNSFNQNQIAATGIKLKRTPLDESNNQISVPQSAPTYLVTETVRCFRFVSKSGREPCQAVLHSGWFEADDLVLAAVALAAVAGASAVAGRAGAVSVSFCSLYSAELIPGSCRPT